MKKPTRADGDADATSRATGARQRRSVPITLRFAKLLAAMLAVMLARCALLIQTPDYGNHCLFSGRDTDCGKCIAKNCQTKVDACCGDNQCGRAIDDVEGCASANDQHCNALHAAVTSSDTKRAALAKCVSIMCRGVCEDAPATSHSNCGGTAFGYGQACACSPGTPQAPANRYQCNSSAFPDTRCCAPLGWPSAGNQCSCLIVSCAPTSDGCMCYLSDSYDPNATHKCDGPICCESASDCHCGSSPCSTGESVVQSCGLATTPCSQQTQPLDNCSLP